MKELYLAQNDSPYTTLAGDINSTQTNITVTNGSILPNPPNLLTLGYEGNVTEVVLMTAKSGNVLTVVRGYECASKSWTVSTKIARIFNAQDYNAVVENIRELEDGWDGVINKNMIPNIPSTYSLGTVNNPLKEIHSDEMFVSSNSLYVDGSKVLSSVGNTVEVSTTVDQHLTVNTSGLGTTRMASAKEIILYSGNVINLQSLGDITALSAGRIAIKTNADGDNIAFETQGTLSNINFKSKHQVNFDCTDVNFTTMPKVAGIPINQGGGSGTDGVSLQYNWDNTMLGIKREDEVNYTYVDLKGVQGEQGVNGINGTNGLNGRDIEIRNNGIYIQSRYVGDSEWINLISLASLKGAKGDTGAQGLQGAQGLTGEQGIKGDKGDNGLSAYEVWVANGGIGTELDYLASIKGEKGEKGDQGLMGLTGAQGIQGEQGIQGIKGDKGDKGDTGEQGIQGVAGQDAVTPLITTSLTETVEGKVSDATVAKILDDKISNLSGKIDVPFPFNSGFTNFRNDYLCRLIINEGLRTCRLYFSAKKVDGTAFATNSMITIGEVPLAYRPIITNSDTTVSTSTSAVVSAGASRLIVKTNGACDLYTNIVGALYFYGICEWDY